MGYLFYVEVIHTHSKTHTQMYYRDLKLGILDEKLNSSSCRCIAAASAMATMYDAEKPAIG